MPMVTAMSAEKNNMAAAIDNWNLYYVLTEELLKFINKADIEAFLDIARQRNTIVERMKALPETEIYRKTPECCALVDKIKPLDMQVIYKAKAWLNKSRRQNAAVHAYDLDYGAVGNILNKKY